MRTKLLIFLFTFTVLFSYNSIAGNKTPFKHPNTVKVISYNILNGFEWGEEPEREKEMIEWIRKQQPDVVGLQELCGFTYEKLQAFAKSYGHDYVAIVKEEGYPVGITSNQPLTVISKQVQGYGHGLLHVETYGIDFLVTHLNPHEWKRRRQEAENITTYIRDKNLTNFLLMGDMNAFSPFDAAEIESHLHLTARMIKGEAKKDKAGNMNNLNFDYSVISTFIAAGYHDVCRLFVSAGKRMTFPTRILASSPQGEILKQYQERLDYIFVSDQLLRKCVDGIIYNGPDTDYLSDHYPIGITIRK